MSVASATTIFWPWNVANERPVSWGSSSAAICSHVAFGVSADGTATVLVVSPAVVDVGVALVELNAVFTTLVVGVAKLGDINSVGRIGGKTLLWFVAASLTSLLLGMILVNLFEPGIAMNDGAKNYFIKMTPYFTYHLVAQP